MISITLNGESREIPEKTTVEQLIQNLKLQPTLFLVEINETALFRSEWENREILPQDRVEIIRVVAGG